MPLDEHGTYLFDLLPTTLDVFAWIEAEPQLVNARVEGARTIGAAAAQEILVELVVSALDSWGAHYRDALIREYFGLISQWSQLAEASQGVPFEHRQRLLAIPEQLIKAMDFVPNCQQLVEQTLDEVAAEQQVDRERAALDFVGEYAERLKARLRQGIARSFVRDLGRSSELADTILGDVVVPQLPALLARWRQLQ